MRDLTPRYIEQTQAKECEIIVLCEADFHSSFVCLHDGYGPIQCNGETWLGGGNIINLTFPEEGQDITARGLTATLSGIPDELITLTLQEKYSGRPFKLWMGFLNQQNKIILDPHMIFRRRMDNMTIKEFSETATVQLAFENRLIELKRARKLHYTDEDKKPSIPTTEAWNK